MDNTARLQCGRCQREVGVHEQCRCRTERAPVEMPTIEPCIFCDVIMERDYVGGVTYFQCPNNHAIGIRLAPDDALILYNTVASNHAELKRTLPLHAATIARQASMIEGLKRQIKKLEKASPPAAVAPYHRLYTEDSE